MSSAPVFNCGTSRALVPGAPAARWLLPAHHLRTHAVLVGATGSGKTGALLVMVEEALRSGTPVLMIDVNSDLPNLLLTFPEPTAQALLPWVEGTGSPSDTRTQNPPTKRPLVALMKQARAFGVGVLVATQNPMDLDYRALGNAGLWCIGRLQTDADRARVLEGIAGSGGEHDDLTQAELGKIVKRLSQRWFVVRDAHSKSGTVLTQPRWAMSFMRGPMTRNEVRRALGKTRESGPPCVGGTVREAPSSGTTAQAPRIGSSVTDEKSRS